MMLWRYEDIMVIYSGCFSRIDNQLDRILADVTPAWAWYGSEFKAWRKMIKLLVFTIVTNNGWFDQVGGNLGEEFFLNPSLMELTNRSMRVNIPLFH